ncbi:hypothetical protein [Pseudoroseicyclus sp. CXY001]|uniref:hypothetical protein n=1 Tax=Pseudoroseicyclus sp. CXY001 TaxID=3242492 RepID=UPI00357120CC
MPFDISALPIGGTTMIVGAACAAFTWVWAGPEIAAREMARDGWLLKCEAGVASEIESVRTPAPQLPDVPGLCAMLTAGDPDLAQLCRYIPDPAIIIGGAERLQNSEKTARVERTLTRVSDSCSCAQAVYVEENRLELALYAASGRLFTPIEVREREAALSRALHSPACRMEG